MTLTKRTLTAALAAAALAVTGLATAVPSATAMPSKHAPTPATTHVCTSHPKPGFASCTAVALASSQGQPLSSSRAIASAFTPTDIQQAYNLTGLTSGGATVAIVDAYGYPTLEADLALFRSTYGLPPCTTANGCLTVMDQHGGSNYPPANNNWDLEQALDVDAVSSACPDCNIIVVQAKTASLHNLGIAVNQAAKHDVVAISNSYIGHDRKNVSQYNHRGIAVTAATGDWGFDPTHMYPADDPHVVAVSGTSVFRDGSKRGFNETAWGGTGSGCAEVNKQPKWQQAIDTGCTTRAIGDVSAAADPGSGGLSVVFLGRFSQVGGTSEATPLIAAVYALSGKTGGYPARFPYKHPGHLYDVTSGSNGSCGAPLCAAGPGWDGVTGIGTPNGVKGF